jgi:glycosyltransferase involved in cell wall biosynthesis
MIRTLQIGDEWLSDREGGLARYYFELLRHLHEDRATATGLVVGSEGVAAETHGQVTAFARADDSLKNRWLALRRAAMPSLRAGQIDLIACHFSLYGLPLLDRLVSTPTVVHFHGPWAAESGVEGAAGWNERSRAMIEGLVYGRARRLIVLSDAFRQELVRRYRVPEDRVRVVPGGVDLERFNNCLSRREARERLGWPTDRQILLTVRRQVRRMGLEDLIDAVDALRTAHPDLLLLLGGSGPISGALRERIAEKGLENNVRLLGRVPDADLPLAYRATDMSVVPTQSLEGFGLIVLESLAAGTPVLATPVGGLPEILRPFAPQCVFADTSTRAITERIGDMLGGHLDIPSEAKCRAYAVENFSWNAIAGRVVDVYEDAMR